MLARNGFVPPGTDRADPPVGCGERPGAAFRANGFVPAVVAERVRSAAAGGEVRAKGFVDFVG